MDVSESESIVAQLADETRLRIIETLAREQAVDPERSAVGFAELQRAVGVENSGNFSYHLDQLCDRFVVSTDAGYLLTDAGTHVASILSSGIWSDTTEEPQATSYDCVVCGDPVLVEARPGGVAFECEQGHGLREIGVPASVLSQGADYALRQATRRMFTDLAVAAEGTCARCHRPVSWSTERVPEEGGGVVAVADCTGCGMVYTTALAIWAIADWDVRARIQRAGVDLRSVPPWELFELVATGPTLVDGDTDGPPAERVYEVVFGPEAGGFTVHIDGEATVREVRDGSAAADEANGA